MFINPCQKKKKKKPQTSTKNSKNIPNSNQTISALIKENHSKQCAIPPERKPKTVPKRGEFQNHLQISPILFHETTQSIIFSILIAKPVGNKSKQRHNGGKQEQRQIMKARLRKERAFYREEKRNRARWLTKPNHRNGRRRGKSRRKKKKIMCASHQQCKPREKKEIKKQKIKIVFF